MSFIRYIKDCIHYAKSFPFRPGFNRRIWLRNVLYVNAQLKYWHGRMITRLIMQRDKVSDRLSIERRKRLLAKELV